MLNFNHIISFLAIPYNSILLLALIISGTVLFFPNKKKYIITANDLTQKTNDKLTILDIRNDSNLRIPKSKLLSLDQINENYLKKQFKNIEETIIIVSDTNKQAIANLKLVKKMGYKNVYILDNGVIGWKNAGLPLIEKT